MQTFHKASLKPYHTFSLDSSCEHLVIAETAEELASVYKKQEWADLPKLILGKGSNMLFTEHYSGVVVVNRVLGKQVSVEGNSVLLHVNGGEDWPELVKWSVENGYYGLENLALIPGCAGSAPIQNIGAYGVELKDVCQYVDAMMLDDFSIRRFSAEECQFGYRDSVFKRAMKDRCVIVAVGLKLSKEWQPNISYGPLQAIPEQELSPESVFNEVCRIRMQKLPDPEVAGNAGSFFKNPVIDNQQFERLKQRFPEMVAFPAGDKTKVAAGWLIDQCGFKGATQGGAQVHPNQALVLVNKDRATAEDILTLADRVVTEVYARYQIKLEHEVRFMNHCRETFLSECLEDK